MSDFTSSRSLIGGVEAGAGPPGLLKPSEVCRILGVSRSWLYAAAQAGRIPSVRLGAPDGPLRFVPEDVQAWLTQARAAWQPGMSSRAALEQTRSQAT